MLSTATDRNHLTANNRTSDASFSRSHVPAASGVRRCDVIGPGDGDAYWSIGDLVTFKVGPAISNGALALAETIVLPGGGPPPHLHSREDEIFYLLDGELELLLADRAYRARAGDAIVLPRGIVHTFHNASNRPARMLVMATPCGFEKFMREFGLSREEFPQPPSTTPRPQDMARLLEACQRYGLELRPDHVPALAPIALGHEFRTVNVMGMRIELKLTVEQTHGQLSLVTIHAPNGTGAPMHAHREQDELFYVEHGTFEFTIGQRTITAAAGTTVYVPNGTMHNFTCISQEPGRLMDVHLPGGFEDFYIEAGELSRNATPSDIATLCDRHGMDVPASNAE